jgi:hypothetical protein
VELLDEQDPVLALAIHNGHNMHPAPLQDCGISEADRLREEDPYTDTFAELFPNRIIVYTSRFTVDLNRSLEQAVYLKPEDCWGLPVRRLPVPENLLEELRQDYRQWYSVLDYTLQRLLAKHPFLLVLDLHSFNHRRQGPQAEPDPQAQNPDIILGRNNMPQEYYPHVEKLRLELDGKQVRGHSLDCRTDVKFTGGRLSRYVHNTYPDRVLCPAVEFKKIFMDEWTGQLDIGFQTELGNLFRTAVRTWSAAWLPAKN